MGVMEIMDPELGDEKLEWDPDDEKSVEKASKKFTKKLAEGFTAFAAETTTVLKRGKKIKKFDPKLGRVLLAAPMIPSPSNGKRTTKLPPLV